MTFKRVEDVGRAAAEQARVRRGGGRRLKPIKTGTLERSVDAVLGTKGLDLSEPVASVLAEFDRRARGFGRKGRKRLR